MKIISNEPLEKNWPMVQALAVIMLILFFMVRPATYFLWASVKSTLYIIAVPVLITFFYYFRQFSDGLAVKLLAFYWGWFFLSRILNGGQCLVKDFEAVIDFSLFPFFVATGIMLKPRQRELFLKFLCVAVALFFTALACVAIVCAIFRLTIYNPITQGTLCSVAAESFSRINILDTNVNSSALWFFCTAFLLIYSFFSCRNVPLRILSLAAIVPNYLALALTYSRNVMLAFSIGIAMLAVLIMLEYIPEKKFVAKLILVICVVALFIPVTYKSFETSTSFLSKVAAAAETPAVLEEFKSEKKETVPDKGKSAVGTNVSEASKAEESADMEKLFTDPRDLQRSVSTLSNRLPIFMSAIVTLKEEPVRLLIGSANENMMTISHTVTVKPYKHFHNTILQTLVLTGIPGLALILGFSILLIVRMIKIFFCMSKKVGLEVKVLTILLTGVFLYSMLEIVAFTIVDFRGLLFFLISGILLGYYNDEFYMEKPAA